MKVDKWLDLFKKNRNKKLFTLSDLIILTGEKKSSIAVQLSRLVKSGIVEHPVRGWYVNPFRIPSTEELSMVVRYPSYLSMEYALSKHGILSQNVFTFTLVTTKLPYTYRAEDNVFEYHQVKKSLFWGYIKKGDIQIAEPEKAFLDLVYIRIVRGKDMKTSALESLVEDMYLEDIDQKRLFKYADSYDKTTRKILSGLMVDE
jgi:predicted transcriptional regulator of viral defense system